MLVAEVLALLIAGKLVLLVIELDILGLSLSMAREPALSEIGELSILTIGLSMAGKLVLLELRVLDISEFGLLIAGELALLVP